LQNNDSQQRAGETLTPASTPFTEVRFFGFTSDTDHLCGVGIGRGKYATSAQVINI